MFDWHVEIQPAQGETICGDNYLVEPFDGGTLIAVVDGLGHGEKAAAASAAAVEALKQKSGDDAIYMLEHCHMATRHTRGSVVTLASVKQDGAMTWLGIGNVSAVIVRNDEQHNREHLLLRGGVVGYRMPPIKAFQQTLRSGDILVMASDGILSGFRENIPHYQTPEKIAKHIMANYFRGKDDATVLVARFL